MADIKTRDMVKGTIKTIDKAAIASERMKVAYAKTKDKAEQGYFTEESSATEYTADKVSHTTERVIAEGVHQFDKQGPKAVKTTEKKIVKAKDKLADFKQKRAAQAAERRAAQSVPEQCSPQLRHGSVNPVSAPDAPKAPAQAVK